MKNAGISVIQSDYNRSGGLTELIRINELADLYNVQLMPHNWKTGITSAACRHFAKSNRNSKYVEYLHPDFWNGELITNLTMSEPEIINGQIEVSDKPGLGIELDLDYLKEKTGIVLE